jgi:hypothetical protein
MISAADRRFSREIEDSACESVELAVPLVNWPFRWLIGCSAG